MSHNRPRVSSRLLSSGEVSREAAAAIAHRVRGVLLTRNLTFADVSRATEAQFPSDSQYHVPHNFYFQLRSTGLSPALPQLIALSRVSNYRLTDWLTLFGFHLDNISRLQATLPRPRTVLLDSTAYDDYAEIPWFRERRQDSVLPQVVPLSQILAPVGPTHLGSLVAANRNDFVYAKIGQEDAFAFPDLLPGSIVRANPQCVQQLLLKSNGRITQNFFLVEHSKGFCCCRLHLASKNRITLTAMQLPFAQVELQLGSEARILGVLDLEFRPLASSRRLAVAPDVVPEVSRELARVWTPVPLESSASPERPRVLLRGARLRAGLSFRDASEMSSTVANAFKDLRYFTSPGSLSDYEAADRPPRHVHKLLTLCILYSIRFPELLKAFGFQWDETERDPIPDFSENRRETREADAPVSDDGFLAELIGRFGEIPFFLRGALPTLSGLRDISSRDVFWIREQSQILHPALIGCFLAIVDRRKKKPLVYPRKSRWEQPLYLLQKRDGSYLLTSCSLENHNLLIRPYSEGFVPPEHFRNQVDAEVVGQIVAIVRALGKSNE